MESFSVSTAARDKVIDITGQVREIVKRSGAISGLCCVYTSHTTAAITINENADRTYSESLSGA
jgi:secondary thiamine-phosphate synthase enzyme